MAALIVVSDLAEPASVGRGGLSMYVLQWLHGLERLGHTVLFLEFLKKDPGSSEEYLVRYFRETIVDWWRPRSAALIVADSGQSLAGLDSAEVALAARNASAVITLAVPFRREPLPYLDK